MDPITNRVLHQFGPLGRLADAALVGGAVLRLAQRRGWVSDETARKLGATDSPAGTALSVGEMVLVVMAAWRLFRAFRRRRTQRIIIDV